MNDRNGTSPSHLPVDANSGFSRFNLFVAYGWFLLVQVIIASAVNRISAKGTAKFLVEWFHDRTLDTFLLPLLLIAPAAFLIRLPRLSFKFMDGLVDNRTFIMLLLLIATICTTGIVRTSKVPKVQAKLVEVLPLVHDEFSYLLQAKGFAQGRWFFDGPPFSVRDVFHQTHVLNEGKFASRYLPGTAAWLTPFYVFDFHRTANCVALYIVAILSLVLGTRIGGRYGGLVTAMLVCVSPSLVMFSNLLLSHLPCLVGVSIFLVGMQQLIATANLRSAIMAGFGLGFAMLCRPLTAAAIGLPFGIWMIARTLYSLRESSLAFRLQGMLCMAIGAPLILSFVLIAIQNYVVCGHYLTTPYMQYTNLYTPRHVYGFENGDRGDKVSTPHERSDYNNWARNLTVSSGMTNAKIRLKNSIEWTLGATPLAIGAMLFLGFCWHHSLFVWLTLIASICIHLVYVPYWLTGILNYHYVLESGFLWLVLLGYQTAKFREFATASGRNLLMIWLVLIFAATTLHNYSDTVAGRNKCITSRGVATMTRHAARYQLFLRTVNSHKIETPALILVNTSIDDLHIEYTRNNGDFECAVLIGLLNTHGSSIEEVQSAFPKRNLYIYSTKDGTLTDMR